jgi:predicted nucleic acid-binding Zn ribbon protein
MIYLYECENKDCEEFEKVVKIDKPIKDACRREACQKCTRDMNRVYTAPGIKTFGDGYKA